MKHKSCTFFDYSVLMFANITFLLLSLCFWTLLVGAEKSC